MPDTNQQPVSAHVAAALRARRGELGMSAQQLAERVTATGIVWNRGIVTSLETGARATVSVDELLALARAFETSPLALLPGRQDVPRLPREIVVDRREPSGLPRVTVDGETLPWFVAAATVGDITPDEMATVTLTLHAELVVQANAVPVYTDDEQMRVREVRLVHRLRRELHDTLDANARLRAALGERDACGAPRDASARP